MRPKTSSEMELAELISEKCSFDKSNDALACVQFIYGVYIELYNRLTRTDGVTPTERTVRHFMKTGFKTYIEAILEGDIQESDRGQIVKSVVFPIEVAGDILVRMFKIGQLTEDEWKSLYKDLNEAGNIIIDHILH